MRGPEDSTEALRPTSFESDRDSDAASFHTTNEDAWDNDEYDEDDWSPEKYEESDGQRTPEPPREIVLGRPSSEIYPEQVPVPDSSSDDDASSEVTVEKTPSVATVERAPSEATVQEIQAQNPDEESTKRATVEDVPDEPTPDELPAESAEGGILLDTTVDEAPEETVADEFHDEEPAGVAAEDLVEETAEDAAEYRAEDAADEDGYETPTEEFPEQMQSEDAPGQTKVFGVSDEKSPGGPLPNDDSEKQPRRESHDLETQATDSRADASLKDDDDSCANHLEGWPLFSLLLGISLAVFIISIDRTIITTAIPYITREFESTKDIGWYGSSYLITACTFQPVYGRVYLQFSEKWSYLLAIAIFEIGSLICGLAPNSATLIVGRAIAGFGSAGIVTGSFVVVAYAVPLQKRPVYTALVGVMFGGGATVGPLFGGIFTDLLSWRWCFYINLPIGAVTVILFFLCYKSKSSSHHEKPFMSRILDLDLVGNFILLSAAIMLFLALEFATTGLPWNSAPIIGLLSAFVATSIIFVLWLWKRQDAALIPPKVLCQRTVAAACMMAFLVYGALLIHAYFLPIWFQGVLGTSALTSGVNMIPFFLINALFSVIAGVFVSIIGYYVPPCIIGNAIATVGCGILTTLGPNTSTAQWAGFQVVVAAGFGLSIQQGFTAVQTVLSAEMVPIGTAAVVASQSLGGAVFISIGNTIFQSILLSDSSREAVKNVNLKEVIAAGATEFRNIVPSESLPALVKEYNEALRMVFVAAVPLAGLCLVSCLFFEWKNVRGKKAPSA